MKVEQTENCILEICCEPTKSMHALAKRLHDEAGLSPADAATVAQFIKANWDLAPKGSLKQLIDTVAANARDYPYV